jgi:hypothetical protein
VGVYRLAYVRGPSGILVMLILVMLAQELKKT